MTDQVTERQAALLLQARSKKNSEALQALQALRDEGWLTDGHLAETALYGGNWRGADLRGANLRGAILSGVDLRETDLTDADLSRTDMIDVRLERAHVHGTDLRNADLIASNLSEASFQQADLRGAALGGTELQGTIFYRTHMAGTDVNNARCNGTIFSDVDLSEVTGLEGLRHAGRSSVDVLTLWRSRGNLSRQFLEGCGVPDGFLKLLPELAQASGGLAGCVISFSYTEQGMARALYSGLQEQGVRCWLDAHKILPAGQTPPAADLSLYPGDALVLLYSEALASGVPVEGIVARAADHPMILLELTPLSDTFLSQLPTQQLTRIDLTDLHKINTDPAERLHQVIQQIIEQIQK